MSLTVNEQTNKTFLMLNSTEHEFYLTQKCWHFNIYKQDKYNIWEV